MRDVDELILKLKIELGKADPDDKFKVAIDAIAEFYMSNFMISKNEVALLFTNKQKTVLSFAHPPYLINAGMIPVNLSEAIASRIYRSGKGFIDNNLQQQRHLFIFESIKTPEKKIMPIWKMIASRISHADESLGVIEISKRSISFNDAGEDFTVSDLQFLEESIKKVSPVLKEVLPDDFRGTFR
ncbi:MAG: GAF domain-containing protein [Acidobacteriota bacterium]